MDCLFCKIASKEIPSAKVYEDERSFVFLDIHPRSPGHTVVIPKRHAPSLIELPDDDVEALFRTVKYIDAILSQKLNPDGVTIGINQGKASGQEVDHLHVHLMPRWHGDGGSSVQSVVASPPQESLDEIAAKIQA